MAGKLDRRHLHTQTDAKVGNFVFAGKPGGTNFALDTSHAKTAGYQDGVKPGELRDVLGGDGFRVNIANFHSHMVFHAGVAQRFIERFVAVAQIDIFANHHDVDVALRVLGFIDQLVPAFQIGRVRV